MHIDEPDLALEFVEIFFLARIRFELCTTALDPESTLQSEVLKLINKDLSLTYRPQKESQLFWKGRRIVTSQ